MFSEQKTAKMTQYRLKKLLLGDFTLKRLLRSILFIYLVFAVYIFFFSDRMIFLPPTSSYEDNAEIIKLNSSNNHQISALYLPHPNAKYTLLYAHGNAEDLGDIRNTLEYLNQLGFNVFAYDYQGYGTSEGKPSEKNAYQDIEAAYHYLTEKLDIAADQIIAYGRSVGGGSVVNLAVNQPLGGLILESAFTSAFRVVIPFPILPFDKFPNLKKIPKIKIPILIIHGTDDQVIPIKHGKKLFEVANDPKLFLSVEGAGHNDLIPVAGQQHSDIIQEFINQY
jgi:fermentation-respiration switch protein FrsA (DUF1100 family)